ncbi:phosphatase PAP2 family protein [Solimonas terrae]|uniref:undecaprenyl-diphosphate phosphatase n=1 Tax=Solimonas terrae TaxID=1396819 RepID=A0A6M2BQV6_9GAMM|nr:phosphatase PAP2 family protein [Solimonas terrae]NGY04690.1 phosphatase PAP2 family protein [Solimonas terrae]
MHPILARRLRHALPHADEQRWLLVVAGFLALACALLIVAGGYHAGFATINGWGRAFDDRQLAMLTQSGDSLTMLSLFLLLAWRYPQAIWLAILSALIATLLSHGMKAIADQLRPPAVLDVRSFRQVGPLWHRDSFPSGHTVTAFVAAGAVLGCGRCSRSARLLILALAASVGFSRIAVGAHWPADVLAGAAVGLLSVWLGICLMRRCRWGLHPAAHYVQAAILAACAFADLVRTPAYVDAQDATRAVACISLALAGWHYLLAPRLATARRPSFARMAGRGV